MVFAVLKDKETFFLEQILLKDQVGNRRQFLQGVWRVGEDKIELLFARLDKSEHISTQRDTGGRVQLLQAVLDKTVMISVEFHANYL